jgi:hypothetical protein
MRIGPTRSSKLRGGRRYFRRLERWPEGIRLEPDRDTNCEMWHWHPDLRGWSARSGRARRAHLRVLFVALERLLARAEANGRGTQVFVSVRERRSWNDALYFHTANTADVPFPYTFDQYAFGGRTPDWLAPYVDASRFEVGAGRFEGERDYVVVPLGRHGRASQSVR